MYEPISSTVPQDPNTQFTGIQISNLSSLLFKASSLTGFFRDYLKRHFADPGQIEETSLKQYIWHDDVARSKILIESVAHWEATEVQRRPAVIIKRRACTPQRMGMGGERHQLPPQDAEGNPHYSSFWVGSHTFFCIGGKPAQTEALATEVMHYVHHFANELVAKLGMLRVAVAEYGEMALLQEWEDHFVIPVTVSYAFEDSWSLPANAPKLKSIALSTLLDM